jgi:hypothetical protein
MNSFRILSVLGIHFGEPDDMSVQFTARFSLYRYSQQCICERFSILKTIQRSHCSMVLIPPDRATTIQDNGLFSWSFQAGDRRPEARMPPILPQTIELFVSCQNQLLMGGGKAP